MSRTTEKSSPVGDGAKMREALIKVREWMEHRIATGGFEFSPTIPTMLEDVVLPALAAPRLNCEVGTAEEQAKRLNEWCNGRHCINCQFKGGWPDECKLRWAQKPYEEGGAK